MIETISDNADVIMEIVERYKDDFDIRAYVNTIGEDLVDLTIRIHTDITDASVTNIAKIYEKRFLPYFTQNVMFRSGSDTNRYKLYHAIATAEKQSRDLLEAALLNLLLEQASGFALDYVADRVGERRWMFYTDRVDRFENDENFRNRLRPYFIESRGTLPALEAAVAPLHAAYGGSVAFYSYRIGRGWTLSDTTYSELARTTRLGGELHSFNPLLYLTDEDLWVLGTGIHTITGTVLPLTGRKEVRGDGTLFFEDVQPGMYLYADNGGTLVFLGVVDRVTSNTTLELVNNCTFGSGLTFYTPKVKLADGRPDSVSGLSHSDLGRTTYLGNRERFGPFSFLVVVSNYPQVDTWRELYLHTIDRFKAAGMLPIVIFRRATMLQQQVIAGDGTTEYTISGVNIQGENVLVFINSVAQEPSKYLLVNDGSDTLIQFSEVVPIGMNVWVNWVEEA